MRLFGWFKNDLEDLDGKGSVDAKEIDSLVSDYKKKSAKKAPKKESTMKKKMDEQKLKRASNKESKEAFGSTTSDDIGNNRRKKLWKYVWRFLAITFLMIILSAAYTVISTGVKTQKPKTETKKVLEGIETEDADYFQSRTVAQITQLAGELKKMKESEKEKESAAKQALIEEAKKNKMLEAQLKELQTKLAEKDKNTTSTTIAVMVEEQVASLREKIDALMSRPNPSSVSHNISPLPDEGKVPAQEDSILVSKKDKAPMDKKEEEVLRKKVKQDSSAIRKEYEYEEVSIEMLPLDKDIIDNHMVTEENKKKPSLHIMTGFAKAILITGVAAPTFGAGKANPVPVILSLVSNQVIANGFDANVEDCMLIGQAYGNMNTVRAEIEITRMSCNVKKDGELFKIEAGVKAWVYGENGIHGLKGRLVDSAGKILTKELAVGFLQGVATAFAQPKTSIQTVGGVPSQVFESGNLKDAAYRGAAQGSANALNSLSEYYTKLLDGAYPFVSVRSGRTVTVMFKGGEDIKMAPYTRVDVQSDVGSFGSEESMEINLNGW